MQSTNSVDYFTAQRITSIKTSMAALVSVPVSDVSLELSASTRRRLADTTILAWTILAASVADAQSVFRRGGGGGGTG